MSKPDWSEAPEWAQWLAQDMSGVWVWYFGGVPYPQDTMWRPKSDGQGFKYKRASEGEMNIHWKETLERRP
ncbi:hypothetical protein [Myoviridae environmental samples]|nr:hypothetical protein [Myoviridae environmental samples]